MKEILFLMQHPINDTILKISSELSEKLKDIEDDVIASANALIDTQESPKCADYVKNEVTLVFDDCHKPNTFVDLVAMRRFVRSIRRRFPKELEGSPFYRINEILKQLENCENYQMKDELMDEIASLLEEKDGFPGPLGVAIKRLIDRYGRVGFYVLGDYNHREKTVTIYMRNVLDSHPYDCDELVISIFAHEIFHAYHFYLMQLRNRYEVMRIMRHRSIEDDIVVEGLASYFEHYFDERHKLTNRAIEIENSWRRYSPYVYPYSGARWIIDDQHFKYIVEISSYLLDKGFRILKYRHP